MLQHCPLTKIVLLDEEKEPWQREVTDEVISCILKHAKYLQVLRFTANDVTDSGLQHLPFHKKLEELCLFHCHNITKKSLNYITGCKTLTSLKLKNNTILTNEDFAEFFKRNGCTQLKSLKLSKITGLCQYMMDLPNLVEFYAKTGMDAGVSEEFGFGCPNIEKLKFKILNTNAEIIALQILKLPKLRSITMHSSQQWSVFDNEHLHELARSTTLSSVKIINMNAYFSRLALINFTPPNLRVLALPYTAEINDVIISEYSQRCPLLEELDISSSGLVTPHFKFDQLRKLNISEIELLQELTLDCPNLQNCDVSFCSNLANVTWNCPSLAEVSIARNTMFDNAMVEKLAVHCHQLVTLNMPQLSKIDDSLAPCLASHLEKLRILNVKNCEKLTEKFLICILRKFPEVSLSQAVVKT